MREKEIEQSLRKAVTKRGGLCLKLISPGWSGAPDRLVLLPGGRAGFVEVKAPGQHPRPLQVARMRVLSRLGFYVSVLDDKGGVERLLDEIGRSGNAGKRESP